MEVKCGGVKVIKGLKTLHVYVFSDGSPPVLLRVSADTFEMVSEDEDGKVMFKVNYHYMSQVKNANDSNSAARSRRLAQEAVTLSTSLPLSSSSSVFVRCDEERLDIMKVTSRFSTVLAASPRAEFTRADPRVLSIRFSSRARPTRRTPTAALSSTCIFPRTTPTRPLWSTWRRQADTACASIPTSTTTAK